MKLQRKYFIIFTSLFVVLSIAMSLTAYFLSNNILLKKYEELTTENLTYLLESSDKELNQLTNTFEFITQNTLILNRINTNYKEEDLLKKLEDDQDVTNTLRALSTFDIYKAIKAIYMYGNNGEEYWYTLGNNFNETENIRMVLRDFKSENIGLDYLGVGQSAYRMLGKLNVLKFHKALLSNKGEKIGFVYFELSADYFDKLYEKDRIYSGTKIYLVDGNQNVIYSADKTEIGKRLSVGNYDGIRVIKKLNRYNWQLISETPNDQILDESVVIIQRTLMMAIVSTLLGIIIIMLITRKIVQPIKKLTNAMTLVRGGSLDVKVAHKGSDEIGILTDNFNMMTSKLQANVEKDIAYNKAINDAEYKALQAQINPHFMYNSLNALKWLANIQKADNISNIVDALWKLLRMTSSLDGQFIRLRDEIEVIDAYGTIQQVRYKGKFEICYDIAPEHMETIIPKYILQPFVENAIFHGIEPKKGTGIITVRTRVEGKDLMIQVEDDGVGIEEAKIKRILIDESEQQDSAGLNNIGVKNVEERLKLLYGPERGIQIESLVGAYTIMTIRIPIEEKLGGNKDV